MNPSSAKNYAMDLLASELRIRRQRNHNYSLRAFAQKLELNPGTLSAVLTGRRPVPKSKIDTISKALELDEQQSELFRWSSLVAGKRKTQPLTSDQPTHKLLNEQNHYQVIAEWEYFAVLNLIRTTSFQAQADWIAQRLGITRSRSEEVLNNLLKWGFVEEQHNQIRRVQKSYKTSENKLSKGLQAVHQAELELCKHRFPAVPLDEREVTSSLFPCSRNKIAEVKSMIRKFRDDLTQLLDSDDADDVYQLSIQLLPITTPNHEINEPGD